MIRSVATYLGSIPPVFIDGLLTVLVLWFLFNQSYFGGDEAAKYLSPVAKFWLNWAVGSGAVMTGGLKSFRSTQYADHQKEKRESSGHTETFTKT